MEWIVRRLATFARSATHTTSRLRSFTQRRTSPVVGLIVISGIASLAVTQAMTAHKPSISPAAAANAEHRIGNIVLVHGAWADGSGWKGVYDILAKDGYNVSVVQEPETSFKEDVDATKRTLAQQDGACILVGHSYGGAVITEAGTDPSVAGLVYIAAHMPDAGENEADDGKRFPSDLSKSGAIKKTP